MENVEESRKLDVKLLQANIRLLESMLQASYVTPEKKQQYQANLTKCQEKLASLTQHQPRW